MCEISSLNSRSLKKIFFFVNTLVVVVVVVVVIVGLISEEIDFFVLESLAMKLREYTRNTPIRRNPIARRSGVFFAISKISVAETS